MHILSKQVIISVIIISFMMFVAIVFLQFLVLPRFLSIETPFAVVTVIPVSYTVELQKNTQQPFNSSGYSELTLGKFSTGMIVKVIDTDDKGLCIRSCPGKKCEVLFVAEEGNEFKIISGPEMSAGYIWWYIESINDVAKSGWAVQNYLTVLFDTVP